MSVTTTRGPEPDGPVPDPGAAPPRAEDGLIEMLPYAAPMFAFLALTSLEGYLPDLSWYPPAYALKVLVVALVSWHYRKAWRDFLPRPRAASLVLAAILGLVVYGLWVGLEGRYPEISLLGKRTGFDPSSLPHAWKWPFIALRLLGLVVLVPLIEELFWRSFLIRWLINPEFRRVPVGRVTLMAAAISAAVFGLSHPEWLPAVLTGLLWAWLLWHTSSLSACFLSHAVANLALGIHVLATGDYRFW